LPGAETEEKTSFCTRHGRNIAMTVEVIFKNGRKGYVNRSELNMLINSRLIQSFKRADGWVRIGMDPLRQRGDLSYSGEEKRAHY
jgi:hypothetical protein